MDKTALRFNAELHITHGSADATWHIIDGHSDNGDTIAIVDPDDILAETPDDQEAVAFLLACAPQLAAALRRLHAVFIEAREHAVKLPIMDSPLATVLQTAGGAVLAAEEALNAAGIETAYTTKTV